MRFEGIAASPGIGIGPLFVHEREELSVTDELVPPDAVAAELARFDRAVSISIQDLQRLRDGIAAELGEVEASIYDAHMLMVQDPEVRRAVERAVREDRHNAAYAFRNYMSALAAHFERVEDDYLSERQADILDVERRVLRHLLDEGAPRHARLTAPAIVVAHEIGPSEVAMLQPERVLGLITEVGGRTSHSAIVARGRGIPAVLSVPGIVERAREAAIGAVDGYNGHVEMDPDGAAREAYALRQSQIQAEVAALALMKDERAITLDGTRVEVAANIELPTDVDRVMESGADGIGLFRTEFFYLGRYELPTEEEQFAAYRMVAERVAPNPVIFRTMDLGGDKVASYLGMTHETNPFLGWRGIRFALHHPEVFLAQLRAIYRAGAHGRARIMFPMVSHLNELERALELCARARDDLAARGVAHDPDIEIGIMVETPSAVWIADVLARHAKFLSIGSNDLVQYTLAMDRDNERLAHLYEPLEPSVLRSIKHTIDAGHAAGRWVGICGEMAGDPRTAVLLVGLGIDEISTSAYDLPRLKAAIRSVRISEARQIAEEALGLASAREVKRLLKQRIDTMLPSFLVAKRTPMGAEHA